MQIPTRLWTDTAMKHTMERGVAEIAGLLTQCGGREWGRIERHAGAVLYRWWHKEKTNLPSPAQLSEILAKEEGWPEEGIFSPTLIIKEQKVEMKIDYLPYAELPIYADARDTRKKYRLGNDYDKQLLWARNNPDWSVNNNVEATVANARLLWEEALNRWYERNPLIRGGFEKTQWRQFWGETLHNWSQVVGESTDSLMDRFVSKMREKYPRYGVTNNELEKLNKKRGKLTKAEIMNWQVQYLFWMELSMYIVYPLTMYAGLLSPIFTDQKLWEDDILALTKKDYLEPMPIYGPCSNIATTELGGLLAMSYLAHKETKRIWV